MFFDLSLNKSVCLPYLTQKRRHHSIIASRNRPSRKAVFNREVPLFFEHLTQVDLSEIEGCQTFFEASNTQQNGL